MELRLLAGAGRLRSGVPAADRRIMTSQVQTFKAYYAAMADEDLLKLAANRCSYVDVAQRIMAEELDRRHLKPLSDARERETRPRRFFAKLSGVFRH